MENRETFYFVRSRTEGLDFQVFLEKALGLRQAPLDKPATCRACGKASGWDRTYQKKERPFLGGGGGGVTPEFR